LAPPLVVSEAEANGLSQTQAEMRVKSKDGGQESSEGVCEKLEELRLRDNLIGELGARELAGALMVILN